MPGTQHNCGRKWTAGENEVIRQLFLLGWGRGRIAKQFNGVTPDMIAGRLTHMNLRRKNLLPVAKAQAAE